VVTIGGGTITIGAGTAQIGSVTASISNSVTIGSLPAISGTVTVGELPFWSTYDSGNDSLKVSINDVGGSAIGVSVPISGTVTANVESNSLLTALDNYAANFAEPLHCRVFNPDGAVWASNPLAISGTVTANVQDLTNCVEGFDEGIPQNVVAVHLKDLSGNVLGTSGTPLPISGTVTANSSNGSLTTRFGSVTTANTAFATSAVTNANRKYLLIQNITTASNVITVGIGFTPTTTQGIQLFAGAGLTFEGSYIPTGAVNLLSSVTASCYTILEA
jgi:hypothetical protein